MTSFNKYICPECNACQLQPATNNLIIKVICNKCGHEQLLSNLLGAK